MNLTQHKLDTLRLMGIDVWVERGPNQSLPTSSSNSSLDISAMQNTDIWHSLQQQVAVCTHCELHKARIQTVFGVGNKNADWMIIGEAPGAEEDKQGEPFVGRAGKLLNAMLEAVGLSREKVFIANILKCRPPNNRDPRPEEVIACASYLKQQIEMIKPKLILALGRIAAQNLLKVDTPISRMRGQVYQHPETQVPVIVTYHPAYLLRSPREKRKSWQDLQIAMRIYKEAP